MNSTKEEFEAILFEEPYLEYSEFASEKEKEIAKEWEIRKARDSFKLSAN